MFKMLVGNGHREFSTKQQQDAHEFLLHLLKLVDVSLVWLVLFLRMCSLVHFVIELKLN